MPLVAPEQNQIGPTWEPQDFFRLLAAGAVPVAFGLGTCPRSSRSLQPQPAHGHQGRTAGTVTM